MICHGNYLPTAMFKSKQQTSIPVIFYSLFLK